MGQQTFNAIFKDYYVYMNIIGISWSTQQKGRDDEPLYPRIIGIEGLYAIKKLI